MKLLKAIDQAVDFVRAHPTQMTRDEIKELQRLAREVYLQAANAGLGDNLPKVSELEPPLNSNDLDPVQFETDLNLPGDWIEGEGDPDPTNGWIERVYLPVASPRWFEAMERIRSLAEGRAAIASDKDGGMTWKEAAERLERLRKQGGKFTSQHKLAKAIGCSSATVNKAIQNTPSLREWAQQPEAAPRAQSLNPVVLDNTSQTREPTPEDEAAIREFIESANKEDKAWFHSLSVGDQLDFLEDPDKGDRILGRKP